MEFWVITLVTLISSVLASTGLWALIQKSVEKKDAKSKMILGLGHDRIMCLGMKYLNRGWITQEEYENLYKYLYKPYGTQTVKMQFDTFPQKIQNRCNFHPAWGMKIAAVL